MSTYGGFTLPIPPAMVKDCIAGGGIYQSPVEIPGYAMEQITGQRQDFNTGIGGTNTLGSSTGSKVPSRTQRSTTMPYGDPGGISRRSSPYPSPNTQSMYGDLPANLSIPTSQAPQMQMPQIQPYTGGASATFNMPQPQQYTPYGGSAYNPYGGGGGGSSKGGYYSFTQADPNTLGAVWRGGSMMTPQQRLEYTKLQNELQASFGRTDTALTPEKEQEYQQALREMRAGLDYGWGVQGNMLAAARGGTGAGGAGGSLGGNLGLMSEYAQGLMDPNSDYYRRLSAAAQEQIGAQSAAQQRASALRAAQSGLGSGMGAERMATTGDISRSGLEAQGAAEANLALQAPQLGMQGLQSTFSPYLGIEQLGESSRQFAANLGEQARQFGVGTGLSQQQLANQMAMQQAQMQYEAAMQNARFQMQQQLANQQALMQQYAMLYGML